MKIFDEKDLITWANRDKAIIGNEYYFADNTFEIKDRIKKYAMYTLIGVDSTLIGKPFIFKNGFCECHTASILPVDAVKEEKKYRACKNIKEFYELVNDYGSDSFSNKDFTNENFMYNLLGTDIHIRSKVTGTEYYTTIITITVDVDVNNYVKIALSPKSYQSFNELFEYYEIELNGEWKPFGVLED